MMEMEALEMYNFLVVDKMKNEHVMNTFIAMSAVCVWH